MVQIAVILLVAFLLVPLADLILNERVRYGVKLVLYLLASLWECWSLSTGKVVP